MIERRLDLVEPIRELRYTEKRRDLDFAAQHRRTRHRDPGAGQTALRALAWPTCKLLWRVHHEGRENIPVQGPVIIAANHASFMDHFFVGIGVPRPVNFMAKSQLFNSASRTALSVLGAYPVIRGAHDEEAHATALAVLARGSVVVIYPQGGRARGSEFGGRARPGLGRMAYDTGAPIVPTAVLGSARVREWRHGRFPRVTVRYGRPLEVEPNAEAGLADYQALATEALARVHDLYTQS